MMSLLHADIAKLGQGIAMQTRIVQSVLLREKIHLEEVLNEKNFKT